jgi:hypothetical protein
MSGTFLVALIAALLAIVYWRVVLVLVGALVIAMIITGISSISDILAGQEQTPTILAPVRPGISPDGAEAEPGGAGVSPEGDPRLQEQPPR